MKTEKKMNKYLFCILLSAFLLFSQSSFAKGGGPNTKKEAKIIKKQLKRNQLKGESEYLFDFRGEYFDIVSVSEESKDAFNEVAETYQEKGINVVLIVSKPYLTGLETREELDEKHKAYVLDISSRLPANTLAIVLTSELESAKKEIINIYFAVGENVNLEDIPAEALKEFEVLENYQKTVEGLILAFKGILLIPEGWVVEDFVFPISKNPFNNKEIKKPPYPKNFEIGGQIEGLYSLWIVYYMYYTKKQTIIDNNGGNVIIQANGYTTSIILPNIRGDEYNLYQDVPYQKNGGSSYSYPAKDTPLGETAYGIWIEEQRINKIKLKEDDLTRREYGEFTTMKPDVKAFVGMFGNYSFEEWFNRRISIQVERFESHLHFSAKSYIFSDSQEYLSNFILENYPALIVDILLEQYDKKLALKLFEKHPYLDVMNQLKQEKQRLLLKKYPQLSYSYLKVLKKERLRQFIKDTPYVKEIPFLWNNIRPMLYD